MSTRRVSPSGIAYDREGPRTGPTVVLVHAGIADRRMWDAQWADLVAVHDCLRMDLRGFGESLRPPDGELSHVDDVLELLDAEGVERCHLVGASLGAGVAVELTLGSTDLAESLLLCPPGGSLLTERTPDLDAFIAAESAALEGGDLDLAVQANLDHWVIGPGRVAHDVDPAVLDKVAAMQRLAFEIQLAWDPEPSEAELEPPASERLDEVGARTLVLLGDQDLMTTREAARRITSGVSGARLLTWRDVAHLPSLERPADFLRLALDWLG